MINFAPCLTKIHTTMEYEPGEVAERIIEMVERISTMPIDTFIDSCIETKGKEMYNALVEIGIIKGKKI